MPVAGLTFEMPDSFRVTCGKVDGKTPKSLPYFLICQASRNKDFHYEEDKKVERALIEQGYGHIIQTDRGEELHVERIPIYFDSNIPSMIIRSYYACYTSKVCECRCMNFDPARSDNKASKRSYVEVKEGANMVSKETWVETPCPCTKLDEHNDGGSNKPCKVVGDFYFQIEGFARGGQYAHLRTHSKRSISRICSALGTVALRYGGVVGLRWEMCVDMVRSAKHFFPLVTIACVTDAPEAEVKALVNSYTPLESLGNGSMRQIIDDKRNQFAVSYEAVRLEQQVFGLLGETKEEAKEERQGVL